MQRAFTLAEVLITLAIIGVVAALTIPSLINKINTVVDKNQKEVVQDRIINSLNLMDAHGEINNTYTSTMDFVNSLSKYLKIVKTCDTDKISECFPYKEMKYSKANKEFSKQINTITTAQSIYLNQDEDNPTQFMEPVGIVLANGTPMIISYDRSCISDPDSIKEDNKKIHSCVAGIYDFNGKSKPNRQGVLEGSNRTDLIGFNGASLWKFDCKNLTLSDGSKICVGKEVITSYTKVDCTNSSNLVYCDGGHGSSNYSADGWAGARKRCFEEGGVLPDYDTFNKIVDAHNSLSEDKRYLDLSYIMWTNNDYDQTHARPRSFVGSPSTLKSNAYKFICVAQ